MALTNGRDMPEDSPEKPFVAIIGQDILAYLVLTHDGPNRIFSLATRELSSPLDSRLRCS